MDEEDMEDMDEDYVLASRLEAGLFTLQQSAVILANLWYYNDISLRKRILLLLHQQVLARPNNLLLRPLGFRYDASVPNTLLHILADQTRWVHSNVS